MDVSGKLVRRLGQVRWRRFSVTGAMTLTDIGQVDERRPGETSLILLRPMSTYSVYAERA